MLSEKDSVFIQGAPITIIQFRIYMLTWQRERCNVYALPHPYLPLEELTMTTRSHSQNTKDEIFRRIKKDLSESSFKPPESTTKPEPENHNEPRIYARKRYTNRVRPKPLNAQNCITVIRRPRLEPVWEQGLLKKEAVAKGIVIQSNSHYTTPDKVYQSKT